MGGGTTETTQKVELPETLEAGANEVLAAALQAAAIPYSPNLGVTQAAFSPLELATQQGAGQMAQAYGVGNAANATGYLPDPVQGAGGVYGYTTRPMYEEMVYASTSPTQRQMRDDSLQGYADAAYRIRDEAGIPQPEGQYQSALAQLQDPGPAPVEPSPLAPGDDNGVRQMQYDSAMQQYLKDKDAWQEANATYQTNLAQIEAANNVYDLAGIETPSGSPQQPAMPPQK